MAEAVLVIGSGGFIGRAMTLALADRGVPVIAVSRSAVDFDHPLVEPVIKELHEPCDFLPLLARSRVALHLATASTPGSSAAQPLLELHTNLQLTASLVQALQAQPGVDLLYMSSGGSLYADTSNVPSNETASLRPRSYHGATKLAAEFFISAWCDQYAARATILRPSNVYGPGQPERPGFGVIPAAFGKILRNEPMHVWGDGTVRRDYVYIDDLVRLVMMVLSSPMPPGMRVFNCCSGTSVSLNELFELIESVAGKALQRTYDASRAVDASCIAMDASLAEKVFGWRHEVPLRDGLERTWNYLNRAGR